MKKELLANRISTCLLAIFFVFNGSSCSIKKHEEDKLVYNSDRTVSEMKNKSEELKSKFQQENKLSIFRDRNVSNANSEKLEHKTYLKPTPKTEGIHKAFNIKNKKELFSQFILNQYTNKLVYIDTRDVERFKKERNHDYLAIKKMADNIGEKGAVFMLTNPNNVEESKKILNTIFPSHKYSYSDGPFIMGYIDIKSETGEKEELIIDLTGMSKNCLINYIQDVEQAIARDTINDLETRRQWRINSLACEIPRLTPKEYSEIIEKLFLFIKSLPRNLSSIKNYSEEKGSYRNSIAAAQFFAFS